MDDREIELKLAVPSAELGGTPLRLCLQAQGARDAVAKRMQSTYFDTPDFALDQAGICLRIRAVDGGHVQTVKTAGTSCSGLFSRGEWETPLAAPSLDALHLRTTGLALFDDDGLLARLEPVFSTHIDREIFRLSGIQGEDAWEIEVALDQGTVSTGEQSSAISEIELELRKGTPEILFSVARSVLDSIPARPLIASKSERGYRLASGHALAPFKAKAPPLTPDLSVADAFRRIARSCLDHLLVNEACLLATGDGEAVHQMRVALRRLRSAIKVFRPILRSAELDGIKDDLRWLLNHLGPARDAEVFVIDIIDPVVRDHPDDTALAALRQHWLQDREAKMAAAITAVKGRQFAALALRLGEWVETGDWSRHPTSPDALDAPIAPFAMRRLAKAVRRLVEAGRAPIGHMSHDEQHGLRILCKQVRYTGEFFSALVPRKSMKVFLGELSELQDKLGQLHDIAVAGPKLSGKAITGAKTRAAGLVSGWHQARRKDIISDAEKAWKRWRALPQPWNEE